MLFYGMGIGFKDKIMLHCFREVKYKQGFDCRGLILLI